MKATVINCSKGQYNLGARKLISWLRENGYSEIRYWEGDPGPMFLQGYDLICLSVIFSWDAPLARIIANRHKHDTEIWCGGPGMAALTKWWEKETGLEAIRGLDARFEKIWSLDHLATFAGRGCQVNCYFCIVPKIEGIIPELYWDFLPAPILYDNNISQYPLDFQDHIIETYYKYNVPLKDANSGFEPRTFTEEMYQKWRKILRGSFRFAFDTQSEESFVKNMVDILKDEHANRKRIYVLIGNEPIDSCIDRVKKVIGWGCVPYVQPMIALNALEKRPMVKYDWTERKLKDLQRWSNGFAYRHIPLHEYAPRKDGIPSFPNRPIHA